MANWVSADGVPILKDPVLEAPILMATPRRRDGHDPILRFQLGPVRYRIDAKSQAAGRRFDVPLPLLGETSWIQLVRLEIQMECTMVYSKSGVRTESGGSLEANGQSNNE